MYSGSHCAASSFVYGTFTFFGLLSQNSSTRLGGSPDVVRTPWCTHHGLGSSAFARRYLRNRCFFLFLRVLRCFSSPGSPPYVMDWRTDTWSLSMWVSPFRNLRVDGYLLLSAAYRSLSRLSSAPSAKASTLRSSLLDLHDELAYSSCRPQGFLNVSIQPGLCFDTCSYLDVSFIAEDI